MLFLPVVAHELRVVRSVDAHLSALGQLLVAGWARATANLDIALQRLQLVQHARVAVAQRIVLLSLWSVQRTKYSDIRKEGTQQSCT